VKETARAKEGKTIGVSLLRTNRTKNKPKKFFPTIILIDGKEWAGRDLNSDEAGGNLPQNPLFLGFGLDE